MVFLENSNTLLGMSSSSLLKIAQVSSGWSATWAAVPGDFKVLLIMVGLDEPSAWAHLVSGADEAARRSALFDVLESLQLLEAEAVVVTERVDTAEALSMAALRATGSFAAQFAQQSGVQLYLDMLHAAKRADRKSTRLNSSHGILSRMPSSA